ncbi:MAG: hypothetical protein M3Z02_11630 [Actinomycetota bacterium]|nr:hypothetical protein [Actinomycetota bacterium]
MVAVPLAYLSRLPRLTLPLLLLALVVGGLFSGGVLGFFLLVLVAAFLGLLGYLSWPALTPGGRAVRLVAPVVMLVGAVLALRR